MTIGRWYFTSPWDPLLVRRGDPIGLRAGADHFADILAPGLNNGTSDARWITLLSWCLKWSHEAWNKAGGGNLSRRDDQRARYAWLRPLELMWVARTIEAQGTGQLRGRRSIQRWLNSGAQASNFGMSDERFRQYRQIGTYGAYRVIFRHSTLLTSGDGWTLAETALRLADLVDEKLPPAAKIDLESRVKWQTWRDDEARYWLTRGWKNWAHAPGTGMLPTSVEKTCQKLEEHEMLRSVLFGEGSVRLATARALVRAKASKSHLDLCKLLANDVGLKKFDGVESLALLPAFSSLADSAMNVMRKLWNKINRDGEQQAPSIEKLVKSADLKFCLEKLRRASSTWLREPSRDRFPHAQVVNRLATACTRFDTLEQQLRALAAHHQEFGGGRRWFHENDGKLTPLIKDTGIAASDYRFRLRSISLLAAQCGIAGMENAIGVLDRENIQDEEEDEE